MLVELSHCRNPDIVGGYWDHPVDPAKRRLKPVSTLRHASEVCREYIERNDLGGGNWNGGMVLELRGGKYYPVAQISYNGRAWTPGHDLKAVEIPLDGPIPEIAAGTKPRRVDKEAIIRA